MSIRVTQITKEQLDIVSEIFRKSFETIDQKFSKSEAREFIADKIKNSHNYIASDSDENLGIILADKSGDSLVVDIIAVLPNQKNKGIGSKLLARIEAEARDLKLKSIKMISDPKSRAYKFYINKQYKSNGWVEIEKSLTT